jgi:hypothetical protein
MADSGAVCFLPFHNSIQEHLMQGIDVFLNRRGIEPARPVKFKRF